MASTLRGIQVITVGGYSAEGAFALEGRVITGADDYLLHKVRGNENAW